MFVIITCNNWDWKKTACSLRCFLYFVVFPLLIFYFFCSSTDTSSCFLYKTSRFHWIYSDCDALVSLSKPKAAALVQYSICACSLCLMLLCTQPAKSFQAYQTTIYTGLICSTYTTTIHAIASRTTWQLLCILWQHVSCHHRSLPLIATPRLDTTCRCSVWQSCKCFWDDRLPGTQTGTVDLTLPDQWNYLISTFEDVDLHAVSVITADPC